MAIGDPKLMQGLGGTGITRTDPGASPIDMINRARAVKGLMPLSSGAFDIQSPMGGALPSMTEQTLSFPAASDFADFLQTDIFFPPTPQEEVLTAALRDDPTVLSLAETLQRDAEARRQAEAEKKQIETIQKKIPRGIVSDTTDVETSAPTSDVDVTDVAVSEISPEPTKVSPEAEAVRAAEVSGIGAQPDITTDVEVAGAETPVEQDQGMGLYQNLLQTSLDSYNEAIGKAPSGAKSMDEYKKEFSDATGIDISGEPDNKAALLAFGLALMQNKAGKGFDVGKMLSSVGEAGTKALPAIEAARKEARAGQLAAGKYAIDSARLDDKTREGYIQSLDKYMRERKDKIMDNMSAHIQSLDTASAKADAERLKQQYKFYYDQQLELLKDDLKGAKQIREGNFKFNNKTVFEDPGLKGLKLTMVNRESDGRMVFPFAAQEAVGFGTALADVNEGINSLNRLKGLVRDSKDQPGGTTVQRALELGQGFASSLGFDLNKEPTFKIEKDADGNEVEVFAGFASEPKPLATADAIRDRIIAQFKRFLTQETGNGISNVDIKNIERLLGNVDFFTDPNTAITRIDEAMKIFTSKRDKINTQLRLLDDVSRYANEQEYMDTRRVITDAINASYKLGFGESGVEVDEKTGLEVFKVY